MRTAECPHCYHQVDVPEYLLPGASFSCPGCGMELTVEPGGMLRYANIEDDMMWDDDDEDDVWEL